LERLVLKEPQDQLVQLVLSEPQACKAYKEIRAQLAPKEFREYKVIQVPLVWQVQLESQAMTEPQALQEYKEILEL
jgi:hypothetical protein